MKQVLQVGDKVYSWDYDSCDIHRVGTKYQVIGEIVELHGEWVSIQLVTENVRTAVDGKNVFLCGTGPLLAKLNHDKTVVRDFLEDKAMSHDVVVSSAAAILLKNLP